MSYPPPYTGQYPEVIYGTDSPPTPHQQQSQQPPGAYPQWETLEHGLQSLQSSHHSTPLQTPTSASFRPIELEEPPHLVPSQAHLSHSESPMNDAPILLHHPHAVQQQQQYEQQQYEYLAQQQQQQLPQHDYEPIQEMGPPGSSALFHPQQPQIGALRSIPSSRGRAVQSHPYYRRTSGSVLQQQGYDSPPMSMESPTTPAAVSPVASSSGGGVSTPIPTPLPAPTAVTKATTRRTRSSAKPKPSVRFDAATKTGLDLARTTTVRAGTPVASTSTGKSSTPPVPLLRSATRRAATSRTSPPSQGHSQATAFTATVPSSGSGPRPTPSSLTTASIPSSSLPHPSTTPRPPLQARPQSQAQALSPRLPLTSIPADMHYSPQTHILTASLELPGVKREHLHVKLGTCYFNHIKFVVVLAKSWPVFWASASGGAGVGVEAGTGTGVGEGVSGGAGGHDEDDGVYEIRSGAVSEEPNVHMRREEEEEEEDEHSTMKTEVTEKTTSMPPPVASEPLRRSRSRSATPSATSPLNMPSTSTMRADPSPSLGPYGIPKRQDSEAPITSGAVGGNASKTDSVGRIVNPNLRERRFGIMRRVIQVPGTTTLSNIDASLEDGVLTLHIDCGPPYEIDDEVDVPIR